MWEIWANLLLPKALKSCPKSKKSPNLITLLSFFIRLDEPERHKDRKTDGKCDVQEFKRHD